MAWTAPTTRSTSDLITASIWNTDLVDNLAYLKGTPGQVELENGIVSDTENTDDLGTTAKRWANIYGVNVFANRYLLSGGRREQRITWPDDTLANYQVTSATTGAGGAVAMGGSGQIVLEVDDTQVGTARIDQETELNNALDNTWPVGKNPYLRIEFSLNNLDTATDMFLGLRTTPGAAIPNVAAENHAGIIWDGTNMRVVSGDGTAQQSQNVTAASGARHIFELFITSATSVELWLDGSLEATLTTRVPTGDLEWSMLLESDGGGGAGNSRLTLGLLLLQSDL